MIPAPTLNASPMSIVYPNPHRKTTVFMAFHVSTAAPLLVRHAPNTKNIALAPHAIENDIQKEETKTMTNKREIAIWTISVAHCTMRENYGCNVVSGVYEIVPVIASSDTQNYLFCTSVMWLIAIRHAMRLGVRAGRRRGWEPSLRKWYVSGHVSGPPGCDSERRWEWSEIRMQDSLLCSQTGKTIDGWWMGDLRSGSGVITTKTQDIYAQEMRVCVWLKWIFLLSCYGHSVDLCIWRFV